jgi:hypothetical protein
MSRRRLGILALGAGLCAATGCSGTGSSSAPVLRTASSSVGGGSGATGAAPGDNLSPLSALVLPATAFGAGYTALSASTSTSLSEPTVTVCGKALAHSDSLRSARLLNVFAPPRATDTQAGEEVVTYRSGGVAAMARELGTVLRGCAVAKQTATRFAVAGAPTGSLFVTIATAPTSSKHLRLKTRADSERIGFLPKGETLVVLFAEGGTGSQQQAVITRSAAAVSKLLLS